MRQTMPESRSRAGVDRRSKLPQSEFIDRYLSISLPVVITDAMEQWELFGTPQELDRKFGNELVQVYNDLFDLVSVTPLNTYLKEWFGKNFDAAAGQPLPYVRWYTRMKDVEFAWADEAFRAFADQWSMPYFLPQTGYLLPPAKYGQQLDPARDLFPGKGLFISGRGARTRLHRDPWASDAVLCQIYGEKELVLIAPSSLHPSGDSATAATPAQSGVSVILKPGEIALIPHGWLHEAVCLTDSISLTWNFVHQCTWPRFFRHLASEQAETEMPVLSFFANLE
jgi:hypothetical protein